MKEKNKIDSFDKLPQLIKPQKVEYGRVKSELVKPIKPTDETGYHFYPPYNMNYKGIGDRDSQIKDYPTKLTDKEREAAVDEQRRIIEDKWRKAHLKDKKFSCQCEECSKNVPDRRYSFSHWYDYKLLKELEKKKLSHAPPSIGTDDQIEKTLISFIEYHENPDEINYNLVAYWVEKQVFFYMKNTHHLPRGENEMHRKRVLDMPDQPTSVHFIHSYWWDKPPENTDIPGGFQWRETIGDLITKTCEWLQNQPIEKNFIEEKITPYVLCSNVWKTFTGFCIEYIEYKKKEFIFEESHARIDREQGTEYDIDTSWFEKSEDLDIVFKSTADDFYQFVNKQLFEVRGVEDDYIAKACRLLLATMPEYDFSLSAVQEASYTLGLKKREMGIKYPDLWQYMKTVDIKDPLWDEFCFNEPDVFYVRYKDGAEFFPSEIEVSRIKTLREMKAVRDRVKFFDGVKGEKDEWLNFKGLDEIENEFKQREKRQREKTSPPLFRSIQDQKKQYDLYHENYNESLNKPADRHPSAFEGIKKLAKKPKDYEYSARELTRRLGDSYVEKGQREYKKWLQKVEHYLDHLPEIDRALTMKIFKLTFYREMIEHKAELADLITKANFLKGGMFEEIDFEKEKEIRKEIEKYLRFFANYVIFVGL